MTATKRLRTTNAEPDVVDDAGNESTTPTSESGAVDLPGYTTLSSGRQLRNVVPLSDFVSDVEVVTESDARIAERAASDAEKAAAALEEAIAAGESAASIEDVEEAERKSRWARLFAKGQRVKADRYLASLRVKKMKALVEEIIATAPKSGDDMVVALQAVEDAAREFMRLADAHDARVADWRRRIEAFQIPWGTTEHGITNYGQVRVNGITIDKIDGALRFGGIFVNTQTGYAVPLPIRAENDDARLAAYRALDAIGEGF